MKEITSPSRFLKQLAIGWVFINLLVVVLVGVSINESRLNYQERAAVITQNLSQILEEYIGGVIRNTDVTLQTVADEAEKQLAAGGINKRIMNSYLLRQKARIKESDNFRLSDEKGHVFYGTEVMPGTPINVADRDYFISLSNNSKIGMLISKPMLGRISHKWVLVVARRINKPDGSFAGVVYSGILLERLAETFSSINTGKNGSVILVDDKRSTICRYPEHLGIGSAVGVKIKSPEVIKFFESGAVATTFRTRFTLDGVERTLSYRRISSYPLYVGVGLAKKDYLSEWRKETAKNLALVFLFFLVTLGLAWMIYRYITQRKQAENILQESEKKYRTLIETTDTGFVIIDKDGLVLDANPEYVRLTGHQRLEDILGRSVTEWTAGHDSDRNAAEVKECFKEGFVRNFNVDYIDKDGKITPVEINATVVGTEQGQLVVTLCRDITERKQAEEEVLSEQNFIQNILSTTPNLIYIYDLIERCNVYANREVTVILGYTEEQLRSMGSMLFSNILHPDDVPVVSQHHARFLTAGDGEVLEATYRMKHSNGQWRWLASKDIVFSRDKEGKPLQILGTATDITESKLAQEEKAKIAEQLRQAQKMEAIGTLAGGVAHDFNNILSAIIGFATMAQMSKNDQKTNEFIKEIVAGANRAAELTHSLLAFSRKQTIALKQVDLNHIVRNINKMLMRVIGEDIKLSNFLINRELVVMADTGQIEQVLLNLATNARDAMPDGGELTIQTDMVNVDISYAEAHLFENTGMYAVLTVSDTGIGMDQKTRENIFEPFFTTKEAGKGTGLGLAMVYGTIKQHSGNINVYSEVARGTTFRICLPMAETEEEAMPQQVEPLSKGKGETILLTEDDPQVRNVTGAYLQQLGYRVIEAENGEEAIKRFIENKDTIAIVLMDVIMPVMNGRQAYEEIKKLTSDVKGIFMSGYTDDVISRKGILEDGFDFIQKPINPAALVRKIGEVLDRKG